MNCRTSAQTSITAAEKYKTLIRSLECVAEKKKKILTPDRQKSQTIFYLKVSHSQLPNKEFSIAKLAIAEHKLNIFDCHNIDFGNRIHCFWLPKMKNCLKNLHSRLPPIWCDSRLDVKYAMVHA